MDEKREVSCSGEPFARIGVIGLCFQKRKKMQKHHCQLSSLHSLIWEAIGLDVSPTLSSRSLTKLFR